MLSSLLRDYGRFQYKEGVEILVIYKNEKQNCLHSYITNNEIYFCYILSFQKRISFDGSKQIILFKTKSFNYSKNIFIHLLLMWLK